MNGSDLNWNYPTVPQKYAHFSHVNQTAHIPRGKVFGGSSAINGLNYYRGNLLMGLRVGHIKIYCHTS